MRGASEVAKLPFHLRSLAWSSPGETKPKGGAVRGQGGHPIFEVGFHSGGPIEPNTEWPLTVASVGPN